MIKDQRGGVMMIDKLEIEPLVYKNFGDVGQPEPFTTTTATGSTMPVRRSTT